MKPLVRTPWNYDRDAASVESGVVFNDPSLAVQSQKDEADINFIVRKFGVTGQLPENVRVPQYADFEDVFDFQTAMNSVRAAEEMFNALPSAVRLRFHNDPQELMNFVDDKDNYDEAVKLGLAVKRPDVVESSPVPVPVPKVEDSLND